jgi:hypothetical protein
MRAYQAVAGERLHKADQALEAQLQLLLQNPQSHPCQEKAEELVVDQCQMVAVLQQVLNLVEVG